MNFGSERACSAFGSTARLPPDVLLTMERFEVQGWEDLYRAAPPELRERYGIRTRATPYATLLIAPGLDVLAFNRATGLGISTPADRRAIGWIGEVFAAARVARYFVPVAPLAEPAALPNWLCGLGLRPYNRWAKLVRGVEAPPESTTDLRIEPIGPDRAGDFANVLARGFEWPAWVGTWIGCTIGRPGWLHYLAFDSDRPVATGAVYTDGAYAWPTWASTLPEYRGRGAHTALLARRILDARERGCTLLTMETAENRPERPSASNRNVLRAGFRVAYLRPNFIGEFQR